MIEELFKNEHLINLQHALHAGDSLLIEELWNAPKALLASFALKQTGKNILIITGDAQEEGRLYHDFPLFTERPVFHFPAWETLPNENISPSPDVVGDRYQVLHSLKTQKEPAIILSSLQACLQKLISPKTLAQQYLTLKVGQTLSFESLIQQFTELGYTRTPVASDKGEFAVRGGIIDVFPVSSPDPFRIEFFGDEIESLRIYDPVGQVSVKPVDKIEITPGQEKELIEKAKETSTLLDYLGPETIVIFDDILAIEDRFVKLLKPSFSNIEHFLDQAIGMQTLYLTTEPIEELSHVDFLEKDAKNYYSAKEPLYKLSFEIFDRKVTAKRWHHPFIPLSDYLTPDLEEPSADDLLTSVQKFRTHTLHFLCSTEIEETNLKKKQLDLPQNTKFHLGYLSSGFAFPGDLIVFPTTELSHRYKIRRQKQRSTYHRAPHEAFDLAPGEMVVHLNNGIGRYLGIDKRPNNENVMTEFFIIEYADNAKLFVPLNQAHLITKYIGATEEIPTMHSLGSTRWKRAKEHTQKAILGYAKDLLKLYAEREIQGGFAFPQDTPDMSSFEEEFPFVETEDQLGAISQVKNDMTSTKPMDRLICGDVGYGKTEVAMRAAFKAVLEGEKQVALLVPTTVLAMQHFENFCERMANFPIRIAVLSRLRNAKETKKTLEQIASGSVDIVIGTHRIISKDIQFKNLGLVIIDEEQRFGVRAKEHLKKLRTGVDVLTLSATPIPRTLYMSLIGARDMSIISTPPQDRLPITTLIADANDQTLKNALLRELARDGQAYVIHNRVETIYDFSSRIQKLLPAAKIATCHGQMHADESDAAFHAFKQGKVDILVATTIVESGLDIPNANTILIDRADRFGLADLYQLRGRVGRWNRRAYAYFLVPKARSLSEMSRRRLNALIEASGYGGGMKIAMRDLEIRGAGDILGTEQSGQISSIGFHLYCKLLKRTIKALQGQGPAVIHEVKMEFPSIDARLPEEFVNEVSLRMEIYQRLGEALSNEEIDTIFTELQDRFGTLPKPALWLYHLTRVRVFAQSQGITSLKQNKVTLAIGKRNIIFKVPKEPAEFEEKLIKAIKKNLLLT